MNAEDRPGYETYQEILKWLAVAQVEGKKFYEKGNVSAGTRARRAMDRLAKLKVQWRKEMRA